MSENSLDITIRTVAELVGAERVAKALEVQIGMAKALGKDSSELQAQLDRVNNSFKNLSPELKRLHDDEMEAGNSAEFLHKNHNALHKLMEVMPAPIGMVGSSLITMMRGPVGPALALGVVIEKLGEKFTKWQEDMDAVGEAAAHSPFIDAVRKVTDAMEEGRFKAEEYRLAIAQIAQHEVTIAQALEMQLRLLHELATAREGALKAEQELDKARREHKQKTGEITPEEAVLGQAAADVQAAKDEADRKKKENEQEIVIKQTSLDKATMDQPRLDAEKAAADQAARDAAIHRARLANFGPEGKVDLTTYSESFGGGESVKVDQAVPVRDAKKKADEQVERLEEKVEQYRKYMEAGDHSGSTAAADQAKLELYEGMLAKAKGQADLISRGMNQYQKAFSEPANKDFQGKNAAAAEADKKAKANADEVDKLRRELDEARKIANAKAPDIDRELAARVATIMQQAVDKLMEMPHGEQMAAGLKLAQAVEDKLRALQITKDYQAGKAPSQEDAMFLMRFVAKIAGPQKDFPSAVEFVQNNKGLQKDTDFVNRDMTGQSLDAANAYLLTIANALGAHAKTIKEAADYVSSMKNDSDAFLQGVAKIIRERDGQVAERLARLEHYLNQP